MIFKAFVELFPSEVFSLRRITPAKDTPIADKTYFVFEFYPAQTGPGGGDMRRVLLALYSDDLTNDWTFFHLSLDPGRPDFGPCLHPDFVNGANSMILLKALLDEFNADPHFYAGLQERFGLFRRELTGKKYRGKPFGSFSGVMKEGNPLRVPPVDTFGPEHPAWWLQSLEGKVAALHEMMEQGEDASFPGAGEPVDHETRLKELSVLMEPLLPEIQTRRPPRISQVLERFIDMHHDAALLFLELLQMHYPHKEEEPGPEYQLSYYLFCEALHKLKYGLERNWRWAAPMWEQVQETIADKILVPHMGQFVQQDVMEALRESGMEPDFVLIEAAQELAEYYNRFSGRDSIEEMEAILEDMERQGFDDPFVLVELFLPQLRLIPPEGQLQILSFLAGYRNPVIREIVGLMCLHHDSEVRVLVPDILTQAAHDGMVSPVTFRRLITMRNWLPEEQRSPLDATIKSLRRGGLSPEPSEKGQLVSVYASLIDGSGSQGLWLVIQQKDQVMLANLLLKQGLGVQDVWCSYFDSQADLKQELDMVKNQIIYYKVDPGYLDLVLQAHIAEGFEHDAVPPTGLMLVAETLGHTDWGAQVQEAGELIEMFHEHMPKTYRNPKRWPTLANQNREWLMRSGLHETWFDDDEAVENVLFAKIGEPQTWLQDLDVTAEVLIQHIFEPRRRQWMNRFLWTGIWLYHVRPKPRAPWHLFLIHAALIRGGFPLSDLGAVGTVLIQTMYSAYYRALNENASPAVHTFDSIPAAVDPAPLIEEPKEEEEPPPSNLIPFTRVRNK
ncbi:hypothetical protein [Acanthopleuribacter pedis]|uniref:Uncharacterized protein n=1 Tax=Acanthopleuribacter pedis TaxID=442870 RepID=A0A8J7U7C4_9BACT|nr:hypothetical protein [Acanthopleuribacter pedis]MBO1322363.1 hypothetical protein [Acanthopleuribacter pedis]